MNIDHDQCDSACLQAKELKCVSRCGGKNHGAALREHMKPLDAFKEPVAQTFSPEQHIEELRVLA